MAEGLDFGAPVESATVEIVSPAIATGLSLGALALFAGTSLLAGWFFTRRALRVERVLPRLGSLPAPLPVVAGFVALSMLAVQGFAVADVYVQTQIVQPSALAYFQSLSTARLLGMSHAHLFGFFLMYGLLAAMSAFTRMPVRLRSWLAPVPLLGGFFDVISWWGLKFVGPQFDWLAMATGSASATVTLILVASVVRESFGPLGEKS